MYVADDVGEVIGEDVREDVAKDDALLKMSATRSVYITQLQPVKRTTILIVGSCPPPRASCYT